MLCFTMKECKLIKGGHTFGQKCKMIELLAERASWNRRLFSRALLIDHVRKIRTSLEE